MIHLYAKGGLPPKHPRLVKSQDKRTCGDKIMSGHEEFLIILIRSLSEDVTAKGQHEPQY